MAKIRLVCFSSYHLRSLLFFFSSPKNARGFLLLFFGCRLVVSSPFFFFEPYVRGTNINIKLPFVLRCDDDNYFLRFLFFLKQIFAKSFR